MNLLNRIAAAGFALELTESGPRLVRVEDGARLAPELLAELKANRRAVIDYLKTGREPDAEAVICRVCGADVSDPETRALMIHPLHCDRGGASKGATDGHGFYHPPAERCPFKEGRAA